MKSKSSKTAPLKAKQIAYILSNHEKENVLQMAAKTGATYNQIYKYLLKEGLKVNVNKMSDVSKDWRRRKALSMLIEGWYMDDIEAEVGLTKGQITNVYHRVFREMPKNAEHYDKRDVYEIGVCSMPIKEPIMPYCWKDLMKTKNKLQKGQ